MLCVQGLLRELLSELDRQDVRRVQVLEAYGEQLAEKNLAEDSALAYLAAGGLERALLQYKVAGQWQMALCLAGRRLPICLMPSQPRPSSSLAIQPQASSTRPIMSSPALSLSVSRYRHHHPAIYACSVPIPQLC